MGKLKAFAFTGLTLFLAGIMGIGCAKKPVHIQKKIPALNQLIKTHNDFVDDKISTYSYSGYIQQDLEKFKPDTSYGESFTNFQLGGIAKIKYFSTSDKKMLDSANFYYQKMLTELNNGNVKASSDMVVYGPLKLSVDLSNIARNNTYCDSIQKYLNLAKSMNDEETPGDILLSQALISSGLNKNKKNTTEYIKDIKNILSILPMSSENLETQEKQKMKYNWYLYGAYKKSGEQDSANTYKKSAVKIATENDWLDLLKE